jgi:hypothetical protein
MRRGLVLVLLVISAFWQVVAIAGQATAFGTTEETSHALLHWQEEKHHHHEDGTVTQDDSDESLQHVAADGCLSVHAIWTTLSLTFAPTQGFHPSMAIEVAVPAPPPDGLRRPPRLTT